MPPHFAMPKSKRATGGAEREARKRRWLAHWLITILRVREIRRVLKHR